MANLESVAALEIKEREYKAEVERAQEELDTQRIKTQKTVQQLAEVQPLVFMNGLSFYVTDTG